MDLSTAIREGATRRPQTTGNYFVAGGSCALGAAYEALLGSRVQTWVPAGQVTTALNAAFPALMHEAACPVQGCEAMPYPDPLFDVIPHLNDDHRWTREAIADWLDAR